MAVVLKGRSNTWILDYPFNYFIYETVLLKAFFWLIVKKHREKYLK